jgi:RimJ/RimL family protein N-acetyltransferase
MNLTTLEIKKINADQSKELSNLLESSDKEYTKYFIPFSFDLQTISEILSNAIKDLFYGVYVDNILVGFYMLRGFDAGFVIPSYGVWISKDYSSKGISKLTLQHAISFCKINNINKLMLKVHPDNIVAKGIYETFGFVNQGTDVKNNNLIYYKTIQK